MNRRRSESDLEMMRRSHPRSRRHLHGNSERRRQNNPHHRTRRATVDTHHGGSTSSDDESMFDIRNIQVFENEGGQSQSQQLVIYDEEQAEKIEPDGSHINNIMEEDAVMLIEGEKEDDCQLYLPPPSSNSGGNEKDGTSFDVDVDEMDVQVDASTHPHHQHSGSGKKKKSRKKKRKRRSSKHQRYAE